tara:strand:- start:4485 stop:5354 length:870 start_codon:yes stop_codon:yes gene_type:complete
MSFFDISENYNDSYYFELPQTPLLNTYNNLFNMDLNIDTSNSRFMREISNNYENNISQEFYDTITNSLNNIISLTNNDVSSSLVSLISSILDNYNRNDIYNRNDNLNNFINSTFNSETKKYKRVINDNDLAQLNISKFQKKEAEKNNTNTECPITFSTFEENEDIITLPCNHNFEPESIVKWLTEQSNTCPICRHEFNYKEILNKDYKQEHEDEHEHEHEDEHEHENEQEEGNNRATPEIRSRSANAHYLINDFESIYDEELFRQEVLLQEQLLNSFNTNTNTNTNTPT